MSPMLDLTSHDRSSHCVQTLQSLDLEYNQLGDQGAHYLADAIKVNRVK